MIANIAKLLTLVCIFLMFVVSYAFFRKFWKDPSHTKRDFYPGFSNSGIESLSNAKHTAFREFENGRNGLNITKLCNSFEAMNVTDENLVQVYKYCTKPSTKEATILAEPDLFEAIFSEENFRDAVCNEVNRTFISGQDLVALASIPGSGNTWTRVLLEELTGTCFKLYKQHRDLHDNINWC